VGSIFEGESVVFLGGLLAHQSKLSFLIVLIAAFFGAVLGDVFWFLIGRYQGTKLIHRFEWIRKKTEKTLFYAEKKSGTLAFTMRFIYGFRSIIPFTLGVTKMTLKKYLSLNVSGACLWVVVVTSLGYLFGGVIESVFGRLRHFELILVILVVLLFVLLNILFHGIKILIKKFTNNLK
jgi:membrane protein DedA with SNARE-associated domain